MTFALFFLEEKIKYKYKQTTPYHGNHPFETKNINYVPNVHKSQLNGLLFKGYPNVTKHSTNFCLSSFEIGFSLIN